MTRPADIMVDIESLGVGAGCVILTIGAVAFSPLGREHEVAHRIGTANGVPAFAVQAPQFSCRIDMIDSMHRGFTVRPETLAWWMRQDAAARFHAFDAGVGLPVADALHQFNEWGASFGPNVRVWCHGATFDAPILSHAMDLVGVKPFWRYDKVRDTRTVFDLATVNLHHQNLRWLPGHNALYDAARQAIAVQRCYAVFNAWSMAHGTKIKALEAALAT